MVSFVLSLQASCLSHTDNLRTVFSKCGLWPPAPVLPEVLIKHADCQHPPEYQKSPSSTVSQGSATFKVREIRL